MIGPARTAFAVGALLAACSQPAGNVLVAEHGGFRVAVPDGWDARATDPAEWADHRTVAIVASQPLDPECAAAGPGGDCTAPLASLAEGELLVWWQSATCAGAGCEPPDGERMPVGGRQASRTGGSHLCDALGATHEEAYFVSVTPQRLDAIVACDRGADEATLAQLAELLEHVSWRTP